LKRRKYFREYRRINPQIIHYKHHGTSIVYKGEVDGMRWLKAERNEDRFIDLNWRGKKVEVKTSKPHPLTYKNTKTKRWKFYLKQKGIADLFLIICLDMSGSVYKVFLIPDKEMVAKNLTFTENSIKKYSKFLLTIE
jgi:hypothetical protein